MNDEINKLMRMKGHWERRIVELSGPDYAVNSHTSIIRTIAPLLRHLWLLLPAESGKNNG